MSDPERPLTEEQMQMFDGIDDRNNFIKWYEDNPELPKTSWDNDRYVAATR